MTTPFQVLTVCTGNVCRSPQAEQLLRAGFSRVHYPDATWEVPIIESAGTDALVSEPMPPQAASLSREFGGVPDSHLARQLTIEMVERADLILSMSREHRSAIAKLSPSANRHSFTLLEFARILVGVRADASRGREPLPAEGDFAAWVNLAARRRGYYASNASEDNVLDPFHRSTAIYRLSAEQIAPAAAQVVESFVTNTELLSQS